MPDEPRLIATTAGDPAATTLFAQQEADLLARSGGDDTGPRPKPDAPTLLLEFGGALVGCVALAVEDGVGEITRMFVAETARGRGLSRVLLAGVERLAERERLEVLRLVTGTEQPEAMSLSASAGYALIPGYGYWGDEPSARCYAKRVVSSDGVSSPE